MKEDIRKQLEVKNREIYINKLNLDLANNMDVLVLTIENQLNSIINDSKSRVMEISESFQNTDLINNTFSEFRDKYQEFLMTLLDSKKEFITKLFSNTKIELDTILENNLDIKEKLDLFFDQNIYDLINKLENIQDNSFYKKRINDYLNNFKNYLNNKIIETLKVRDIILCNTFKESYIKYQELNKNTLK